MKACKAKSWRNSTPTLSEENAINVQMRFEKLTELEIKLEVKTFTNQPRSKIVSSDIKNIVNASQWLIYNFFSVNGPDKDGYASVKYKNLPFKAGYLF